MKYWPEGTRPSQKEHAEKHVQLLEFSLNRCRDFRTAIQAGGNVGYWPARMAQRFDFVMSFEPEPETFKILVKNLHYDLDLVNVTIRHEALGSAPGRCDVKPESLGSHTIIQGDKVDVVTIDSLGMEDVDLIQLDIEGYEYEALKGGIETIKKTNPIIQLEMRSFAENYGGSDQKIIKLLKSLGYKQYDRHNHDYYFEHVG